MDFYMKFNSGIGEHLVLAAALQSDMHYFNFFFLFQNPSRAHIQPLKIHEF